MPRPELLAEKVAAVERHLARVASCLTSAGPYLEPMTDKSDGVILHLWQATQIVLDVEMSFCVENKLGAPGSDADAFRRLGNAGLIEVDLADRLVKAAGFRNLVAHADEELDLHRVRDAATQGPGDLRRFLAAVVVKSRSQEGA